MKFLASLLLITGIFSGHCRAEEPADPSAKKRTQAAGVFVGRKLPLGVYGASDIYPFWGFRYGHEIWGINPEYTFDFVNARWVTFYTASLSFAFPDTFEDFHFIPLLGLDFKYYSGHTPDYQLPYKTAFGFHFGVSPVLEITEAISLRVDFKLSYKPGLTLDVAGGFSYAF